MNKFINNFLLFTFCAVGFTQSLSAFTVINQTDKDRVLTLQEAYRPEAEMPGNLERPIALNSTPIRVVVPAKSAIITDIAPCTVLLVNMKEIVRRGKKNVSAMSLSCYEPYSLNQFPVDEITDDWGLVIHDPIPTAWSLPWEKPYGIKLVHPELLEKIDSLDVLPVELRSKGPSSLKSRFTR